MPSPISKYVQTELSRLADEQKAVEMAAYMKTDMPFWGVQKPDRVPIIREMKKRFAPRSLVGYEENIRALWEGEKREEKYLAINYAESFKEYMIPQAIPIFERLVREGQWWDYVDPIASWLVGRTLLNHEEVVRPTIESYVEDEDFWIRRTALLAHLGHKEKTRGDCLLRYCSALSHEKEFFIRKAIGWALREYSKSEPDKVAKYLKKNESKLSPLSYREGAKHLIKIGVMSD